MRNLLKDAGDSLYLTPWTAAALVLIGLLSSLSIHATTISNTEADRVSLVVTYGEDTVLQAVAHDRNSTQSSKATLSRLSFDARLGSLSLRLSVPSAPTLPLLRELPGAPAGNPCPMARSVA
ncbi:hypothetical protein [Terriglobus albidus]|uniref:hypothetical protein n=1 Tax=Terriglobus albidus TaxID=1592106 RepID=UPI0021DFBE6F|nr:hypothetical protein [Terriglobus albidus]